MLIHARIRKRSNCQAQRISSVVLRVHRFPFLELFAACLLASILNSASGQGVVVQGGFKAAQYYGPPHQTQKRFLLTGSKAEQLAGGLTSLSEGKLQTFLENGETEMVIEAPQCRYDEKRHSIDSSGPLRVQTADGNFSIEGQGFVWQQTNSVLIISNNVHTVVHPELLQNRKTATATHTNTTALAGDNIEIWSQAFDYTGETGIGNYRRDVRVKSPDYALGTERLEFLLPMKEKQLQRLSAEQNVTVESGEIQAAGQHALYSPETGVVHVSGAPTWRASERRGRGDELVIDRSNRVFTATGHAFLSMAVQNAGSYGFLTGSNADASASIAQTNRHLEIASDSYVISTNSGIFRGGVQVTDKLSDQPQGTMTCGQMSVWFSGTNEMDRMVAEQNVLMNQETKKFKAERAIYTRTNGILELTGNPSWEDGDRQGHGDIVALNGLKNELSARGHAFLRLPAQEVDPAPGPLVATPRPVSDPGTNRFAEVTCQEYILAPPKSAFFQGHVLIRHSQMNLTCEKMRLDSPRPDGSLHTIVAQDSVEFDLFDEHNQKIHGVGQQAVYTYNRTVHATNDLIELTGNPVLTMTNGTVQNSVILLDRTSGKLLAPGKYIIRGTTESGVTNTTLAPRIKSRGKS